MSVTLPTCEVRFTDGAARLLLEGARWGDTVVCPHCEGGRPYRYRTRHIFKCRDCARQFTATTGTKFDRHKLTPEQIVRAILWWEEFGGEASAASLGRLIGVSYKTAYALKLRLFEYAVEGMDGRSVIAFGYLTGFTKFFLTDGRLVKRRLKDGAVIAL